MTTTYFLNCVAGNIYRTQTNPAIPLNYYLGLSTTEPAMDGTGVTEPQASAAYMRVIIDSLLSAPTDGVVTNTAAIIFNESTADWGTARYFVVYDSLSGGNLLQYNELTIPRSIEAQTIITVKPGDLVLTVSNPT